MTATAVSILIPNFENGRESSRGGERDLIGDLLASLAVTLADDPTAVEIIIADDGSADDSLETCRRWSARTWVEAARAAGGETSWRGDAPFCRLIELPHGGVLSMVSNRLLDAAAGAILCRLDGDVVVHTPRWAELLVRAFEGMPPDVGIVGPRQLAPDGYVHAAGDWVLHPRGYHHVGQGCPPDAVPHAREVDHVMGCFYCLRRTVWEDVGAFDETILRGQTVDYSLRARLAGWRCWYLPTISFTHYQAMRQPRANEADTVAGIRGARRSFRRKWGFDRLAPDLDAVAERYAGTPLLWNAEIFGPRTTWPPRCPAPVAAAATTWARRTRDEGFRAVVDEQVAFVRSLSGPEGGPAPARLLQVGCRDGLLCHLLGTGGMACTGIDGDEHRLDAARALTSGQSYPGRAPGFIAWPDRSRLPVLDRSADLVLLFDVLASHPNPVGLLHEVHRVLAPGGRVAILERPRRHPLDDGTDPGRRYRPHELNGQLRNVDLFDLAHPAGPDAVNDPYLVVVAVRREPGASSSRSNGTRAAATPAS